MISSEECREHARRCLEMANNSADEKFQSKLFDMAHEWNKLAAELEGDSALKGRT
jgi:hypothetical protein